MAKYLISFPSAAMVVPDGEWQTVGRVAGELPSREEAVAWAARHREGPPVRARATRLRLRPAVVNAVLKMAEEVQPDNSFKPTPSPGAT